MMSPPPSASTSTSSTGWPTRWRWTDTPYTLWNLGERAIGGMARDSAGSSRWDIFVAVADCDAAVAKAQELGGSVAVPAVDSSVGRFAGLTDPHGAPFGVIQLAS